MKIRKILGMGIGAILLATMQVHAVAATIVDAIQIVITNHNNDYLQVAEVQAFDFTLVPVNVAASSTGSLAIASNPTSGFGTLASLAIDGNLSGAYGAGNVIYHSSSQTGESLTINLSAATNLSSLTIFGRTDACCTTRDIYDITIISRDGSSQTFSAVDATSGSGTLVFSPIPEPSEWAMMLCGLFAVAGIAKKKRKAIARLA